jgi:tetratricopeptide (TPR) repeat protein
LLGLARWLRRSGQPETALELYRRSIDAGLPDSEMFPALWESALLEKKLGRHEAKVAILTDLAAVKNPFRQAAYEELAKHYERQEKQLDRALAMTEAALEIEVSEGMIQRRDRLTRRMERLAAKQTKGLFQQA